jgi:hypothetical protein
MEHLGKEWAMHLYFMRACCYGNLSMHGETNGKRRGLISVRSTLW